jgi:hypothetical protein
MKATGPGALAAATSQAATRLLIASRLVAVLAGVGALCVSSPALASRSPNDAAATRAYLRASEGYARGASTWVAASVAAIAARASEIAGECPSALTYAPRDVAFGEIGDEASTSLFYAGLAPSGAARLDFARAVGRLRWSNPRLTRLVRGEAADEVARVALGLPDVCADIEAWKASAYAALPQSATEFTARLEAIESEGYVGPSEESLEAVIMRLLKPYEGRGERRIVKQIEGRERHIDRMLGAAGDAARVRLAAALGVSTL